jgi:hypothetical protein
MTFPHGLFENLDCSRKLLLLLLIWSKKSWLLKGCLAWRQGIKSTGIIKRPFEGKEGEQKSSVISGTKDNFVWELHNHLAHTFTQLVNLRGWRLIILRCNDFKSWRDAPACEDTMHMLVWYGAHDACWNDPVTHMMSSDCEGNHRKGKDVRGESLSHNQDT